MPFITREEIDDKTRAASLVTRKTQLRQALLDPALSEAQHAQIRTELANLGQRRVYSAESLPKPGAVSFEPAIPSNEVLAGMKKVQLVSLAVASKVSSQGTKAVIAGRLQKRRDQ